MEQDAAQRKGEAEQSSRELLGKDSPFLQNAQGDGIEPPAAERGEEGGTRGKGSRGGKKRVPSLSRRGSTGRGALTTSAQIGRGTTLLLSEEEGISSRGEPHYIEKGQREMNGPTPVMRGGGNFPRKREEGILRGGGKKKF